MTAFPHSKLESIGPDRARELLKHNFSNRNPKPASIEKFARDMENARWRQVFTPILLSRPDETGVEQLLDGQNRLMAVIEAEVTLDFVVVRGLDPDVQAVVDSGNSRSVGDSLHMAGIRRGNTVGAVARLLWGIRQGEEVLMNSRYSPSNQEIIEIVNESPAIYEAVTAVSGSFKRTRISPSNAALVYYFGMLKDPEVTQAFFTKLIAGTGDEGEPVVALRNRMLQHVNGRPDKWQQLFLTLRALTATRNGETMSRLQLPRAYRVTAHQVIDEINELTKEIPGGRR